MSWTERARLLPSKSLGMRWPRLKARWRDLQCATWTSGLVPWVFAGAAAWSTAAPELDANLAYGGMAPALDTAPYIEASMAMRGAAPGRRADPSLPTCDAAPKVVGTRNQIFEYEAVNVAFYNNASAERCNGAAARLG